MNSVSVLQWGNPTGLRVPECAMEETSRAYEKKYFDRWSNLLHNSLFKGYYRYIAVKYEPRFAKYDYSLTKGFGLSEATLHSPGKLSDAIGAFYCRAADAGAFIRRLSVHAKWCLKVAAKAVLPEFVVDWVRQARRRQSLDTGGRKGEVEVRGQRSEVRGQRAGADDPTRRVNCGQMTDPPVDGFAVAKVRFQIYVRCQKWLALRP